jgi:hypothetical protein
LDSCETALAELRLWPVPCWQSSSRPPVQIQAAFWLLGIEAGFLHPDYRVLMQFCSTAALADPNRVQTCGDLAATLIEHGRTQVEVMVGGKVADQIESSDPRLSALGECGYP